MKNLIKIIFSLVILNLILNANAQTVTWQKWYDYNNYEDNGEDVIQTFDGGYLILSNNYIPDNYSSVLTKTDEYGNILWQKLYDRNTVGGLSITCNTVSQQSDGGYLISGGNVLSAILIRTDNKGEIVWIKNFTRPNFFSAYFLDHKITMDGGIIACGYIYDPGYAYTVKTDSLGNLEWDSVFTFDSDFKRVIESEDGSLYFLGILTTLYKTNLYGDLIWKINNQTSTEDLVEHPTGDIYIGGGRDSLILSRIDTAGKIIFEKSFYQGINGCLSMCLSKDNNLLLAGADNTRMAVSKINFKGDLIFSKQIISINNTAYAFLPIAVNSTNDSGFIFTGFTNYPPTYHESNIYVSKTDSSCNAPLILNIANNNSIIPKEIQLYQNYPNPFNPSTIISFYLSKSEFVTLKIFDIKGNEVGTLINEFKTSGKHEVTFNSHDFDLSSGIFIYQLKSPKNIVSKIMLLIK